MEFSDLTLAHGAYVLAKGALAVCYLSLAIAVAAVVLGVVPPRANESSPLDQIGRIGAVIFFGLTGWQRIEDILHIRQLELHYFESFHMGMLFLQTTGALVILGVLWTSKDEPDEL